MLLDVICGKRSCLPRDRGRSGGQQSRGRSGRSGSSTAGGFLLDGFVVQVTALVPVVCANAPPRSSGSASMTSWLPWAARPRRASARGRTSRSWRREASITLLLDELMYHLDLGGRGAAGGLRSRWADPRHARRGRRNHRAFLDAIEPTLKNRLLAHRLKRCHGPADGVPVHSGAAHGVPKRKMSKARREQRPAQHDILGHERQRVPELRIADAGPSTLAPPGDVPGPRGRAARHGRPVTPCIGGAADVGAKSPG